MSSHPGERLDLQTAADALGVHYQTAYRWVRSGRLPAELIGSRYLVARSDVERLDATRHTPRPLPAPTRARVERAGERMYAALLSGDEATARAIARKLIGEGTSIVDLIQYVVSPPLQLIGQRWHEGKLTIWVEHRASAIVERILGELAPNPRGRRRGIAMVAAVAGDRHSLPTTMAAVALRSDHWHAHHLGADMPPDELVRYCTEHHVTLAVISATNPDTADLATETAHRIRSKGVPTIVGAQGRTLADLLAHAREVSAHGASTPRISGAR